MAAASDPSRAMWTFDNALLVLTDVSPNLQLPHLDQFLLTNKLVLLDPNPFKTKPDQQPKTKEALVTVRQIKYTCPNKLDAETVASLLNVDYNEVVRIISQLASTFATLEEKPEKYKLKLPDDRKKQLDDQRVFFYCTRVLQERLTILRLVIFLLRQRENPLQSPTVRNLGKEIFINTKYMASAIDSLNSVLKDVTDPPVYPSEDLETLVHTELIIFVTEMLKVMFELLLQNPTVTVETTTAWFKDYCARHNWLLAVGPAIAVKFQEQFELLKGLTTMCSVLFLDLERSFDVENAIESTASKQSFYYDNYTALEAINRVITEATRPGDAPIVSYCWLVLLWRKLYFIQDHPLAGKPPFNIQEAIHVLQKHTSVLLVFSEIALLNNLLKFDGIYLAVLVQIILASPLQEVSPELTHTICQVVQNCSPVVIQQFFNNPVIQDYLVLSRTRFPLELTPFINLALINGQFADSEFHELRLYTTSLSKQELERITVIDDDNTELIKLREPLQVYPPHEITHKLELRLDVGTKAKALPAAETTKSLVAFLYQYSGWELVGRILHNISKFTTTAEPDVMQVALRIVQLINQVLEDSERNEITRMFRDLLVHTENLDIFEVVLRLFEQALHTRNVELATAGVNFLRLSVPYHSAGVWAYLARLLLFSADGKQGLAAILFGAIEMVSGNYDFTFALVKLTEALARDCMEWSAHPVPHDAKPLIMARFAKHLIYVFESFTHCLFNKAYEKLALGVLILLTFLIMLVLEYAEDYSLALAELATLVYGAFMADSHDVPRVVSPLLAMIDTIAGPVDLYEVWDTSGYVHIDWIQRCLEFCKLLVDIHQTRKQKVQPKFEEALYRKMPQLVLAYTQSQLVKRPIMELLSSLVLVPLAPLILSFMGQKLAEVIIRTIKADLQNLFMRLSTKDAIYDFICAITKGDNQQGLLVLLVSDDSSKLLLGNEEKLELITTILKNNVSKVTPHELSYRLLNAIALTFNLWATVRQTKNSDDSHFIDMLTSWMADLSKTDSTAAVEKWTSENSYTATVQRAQELRVVSKIAEILALYLFTTTNKAEYQKILDATPKIPFESLFSIRGYLPQLYSELDATFETFNTSVTQFINRLPLPEFYRVDLMHQTFGKEERWPKLLSEVEAAATNKLYIMAQADVAKLVGALVVSLCRKYPKLVTSAMLKVAATLLQLNYDEGIPAQLFELVFNERSLVAFYLVYCVFTSDAKVDAQVAFDILKLSLSLLSMLAGVNFLLTLSGQSLTSLESQGNYRPLLRIVYCALKMLKLESRLILEQFSVFLEVFDLMCKAIRTILNELLNKVYLKETEFKTINPLIDDLVLVLSIFEAFLGLQFTDPILANSKLTRVVEDNDTIKVLLNFYSMSHLIEINQEFVFARLSLMLILELMSFNEAIADKFVQAGLFVVLVESPMSLPLRKGGVTITNGAQYHRIWTNGILPIIITTLSKIGASAIPEVSLALQLFGKQIGGCILSWENDSSLIQVSTASISETGQILLIYEILKSMSATDYLANVYRKHPKLQGEGDEVNDMPMLSGLETPAKREKLLLCLTNLLKHPKFLSTRIVPSSNEERLIMEAGSEPFEQFVKGVIDDILELKDLI